MYALIIMLAAGATVPDEIEKLAAKYDKTPQQVCQAILNIELQPNKSLDVCEKKRGSKVTRILPSPRDANKCDPSHGHYTLVGTVCYCNADKHSELEVLQAMASVRHMHNLKNPCESCYYAIIAHMLDKDRLSPGEKLTIEYANRHPDKNMQKHMTKADGKTVPLDRELKKLCSRYLEELERGS